MNQPYSSTWLNTYPLMGTKWRDIIKAEGSTKRQKKDARPASSESHASTLFHRAMEMLPLWGIPGGGFTAAGEPLCLVIWITSFAFFPGEYNNTTHLVCQISDILFLFSSAGGYSARNSTSAVVFSHNKLPI